MNQQEFEALSKVQAEENLITGNDIDGPSRILIYGYTAERNTFITRYNQLNNEITVQVGDKMYYDAKFNESYVPTKRVYPDRCDYEFCKLLIERGVHVPFLGNYEWPEATWDGNQYT